MLTRQQAKRPKKESKKKLRVSGFDPSPSRWLVFFFTSCVKLRAGERGGGGEASGRLGSGGRALLSRRLERAARRASQKESSGSRQRRPRRGPASQSNTHALKQTPTHSTPLIHHHVQAAGERTGTRSTQLQQQRGTTNLPASAWRLGRPHAQHPADPTRPD